LFVHLQASFKTSYAFGAPTYNVGATHHVQPRGSFASLLCGIRPIYIAVYVFQYKDRRDRSL